MQSTEPEEKVGFPDDGQKPYPDDSHECSLLRFNLSAERHHGNAPPKFDRSLMRAEFFLKTDYFFLNRIPSIDRYDTGRWTERE